MTNKLLREHKFRILFWFDAIDIDMNDEILMKKNIHSYFEYMKENKDEDDEIDYIMRNRENLEEQLKIALEEREREEINEENDENKSKNLLIEKINDDFITNEEYFVEIEEEYSDEEEELVLNFFRRFNIYKKEIDEIIQANLKKWNMSRMAKEDVNILRLCVFEMYYDENIDIEVAINEAIELAKVYGNKKVAQFINGILRSIYDYKSNLENKMLDVEG